MLILVDLIGSVTLMLVQEISILFKGSTMVI
uniref:Uncharacterized protein n=1 Tax=Rhizophora mucronata TaxID=61149 RepID=A0A2P2KB79_RHIMU